MIQLWKVDNIIESQHGGKAGSDTAWISFPVANPPVWLRQYGGSLPEAISALSKLTGFQVKTVHEELGEA